VQICQPGVVVVNCSEWEGCIDWWGAEEDIHCKQPASVWYWRSAHQQSAVRSQITTQPGWQRTGEFRCRSQCGRKALLSGEDVCKLLCRTHIMCCLVVLRVLLLHDLRLMCVCWGELCGVDLVRIPEGWQTVGTMLCGFYMLEVLIVLQM